MTAKELAEMLSGREVGNETTPREEHTAKDAGLVVVYGYSDDNVEFRGAIDDEVGAYEDTTIYLTKDGLLKKPACSDAENCTCPYFETAKNAAKTITAIWRDGEGRAECSPPTSPTRHSPSWRTASRGASGSCSAWRIWGRTGL